MTVLGFVRPAHRRGQALALVRPAEQILCVLGVVTQRAGDAGFL